MPEKGIRMLRVKDDTARALRMYAGEVQAASGRLLTDDETIKHFIESFRPELLEKAQSVNDEDVPAKPLGRRPKAKGE